MACYVLQDAGRAEMSAQFRIFALPGANDELLPFRITLSVTVSLIRPAIFEPILYTTKTATSEVEEAQRRVLNLAFPPVQRQLPINAGLDVPTLYAAIGPAPSLDPPSLEVAYQPAALVPSLLPFQRRTVAWLLSREHKMLDANEQVVARIAPAAELPLFWRVVFVAPVSGQDETWYLNDVTGEVSNIKPDDSDPPSGILAEEPGLGKTLESIALVLLNPSVGRNPTQTVWNPDARIYTKKIKTTLIVTPASLAQQWADELKLHAPSLKILVYEGWQKIKVPITENDLAAAREERAKVAKKAKARAARAALAATKAPVKGKRKGKAKARPEPELMDVDADEEPEEELVDWCTYADQFDVCITTYNVLQQDLGIARPPPDRPRRSIASYINLERSRSPLVMCEWYRVIMDEVQMVGGGKTEEMVSLIPRVSSFAVSGTPARSHVADLIHVLHFLRVGAITDTPRLWNRLLLPGYTHRLIELFSRFAVRTMKTSVRGELTIPKQTRYLVPIELGRVERHVYDQNLEKALLELGFDARGVAVAANWQVDVGTLRGWLRKLRGICTHPQVGQLQNVADKLHKPGVLKTIGEVLDSMQDQNWRNLMEDRRSKAQLLTVVAQLYQHHGKHFNRYQIALDTLLKAEKETNDLVDDVQARIDRHDEQGKRLKAEAVELSGSDEKDIRETGALAKGKAKAREDGTPNPDEDDLPRNAAGEEHRLKKRGFQQRLRDCQITLHKVCFLKGDVYHVLGNTEEETTSYEKAEQLRRVLLRSTEEAARRAMAQLAGEMGEKSLSEEELMVEVPYVGVGGIRSSALMEEVNEIIDELLNPQSALLWKWRNHLVQLLTAPLTSGDDDADGQEYARSLETQGEAESYIQVYAALLADRREIMTAERTLLAIVDVKEKKTRSTKAAAKAAQALLDDDVMVALAEVEAQPEDEVLKQTLHEERRALLEDHNSERAVRSIMVELSNIAAGITRENDPEKIIAYEAAQQLRKLIADQAKLMEQLQADLALLRKAFNERIQYFRQLQELSDTVAEAAWEGSVVDAIEQNNAQVEELEAQVKTGRARQRYLEHLANSQHDGNFDEEDESCVLCKCDFEKGYITQWCAHFHVFECMRTWLLRKEGKTCPVCRVPINPNQMQRFKIGQKPSDTLDAPAKVVNNEPAPKSKRHIEYNLISPGVLKSIESMECNGSYGSKIQTLIRHLLYLQIIEPGAKSIVFSAWADSLFIIEHALSRNSIPYVRIDQSRGKESAVNKFKSGPSIQVLLLHGQNAGLNVTCASRVFLVESVVHHAFEIQAIARIDRMGQSRPTEVFCYYAEETVERNILDLAARRGQSLYTKENAAGTLTADPITTVEKKSIDAPKKKAQRGDFVFKTDDMLAILFPHLFEDIEYLVQDVEPYHTAIDPEGAQPVAGPSRLA
ncbi:hypothetical protein PHLGIDRAFT_72023 [Phlebiopsis gigantea 11061_1 CR5-6]|uniref:RING-type domain-containing protein n=1 Tax=Phlebiopsis gigantea (strain 11061_1 CR5-6) TaxID=745531 RepID=A0A0C3SAC3_PHLG1|nr:hypothetical protein PHLGIDRAFT_72023 [Phlebiopsis gigantea 11061_1 CR5-6]